MSNHPILYPPLHLASSQLRPPLSVSSFHKVFCNARAKRHSSTSTTTLSPMAFSSLRVAASSASCRLLCIWNFQLTRKTVCQIPYTKSHKKNICSLVSSAIPHRAHIVFTSGHYFFTMAKVVTQPKPISIRQVSKEFFGMPFSRLALTMLQHPA
ncbi:unnamed protein product [Linum trigynum]|uniref:Uncharacterized protein n=1 Tax=Linum trigynum TaxID=586398 RepID=A0AAV2D9F4_9ROSI